MRNTCSKLFSLFSKLFQDIEVTTPAETQLRSEDQFYQVTSHRRRKNSPEPRMVRDTNTTEPVLEEITNLNLNGVHQRAQFEDPNQVVWDFCWDTQNETAVILCGSTGQHRRVNCEGSNKQGWQLTLRDMMKLAGYNLDTYRLDVIWADDDTDEQDLCNSTIENLPISQFKVI
jgi:hypothetical protein